MTIGWYDGHMTTRHAPSSRTQRSRAAAVSATLRKSGHRPMPSGSTRHGLLKVRSGLYAVTVVVNTELHPASVIADLIAELVRVLESAGYTVAPVRRNHEADLAWIEASKPEWRP